MSGGLGGRLGKSAETQCACQFWYGTGTVDRWVMSRAMHVSAVARQLLGADLSGRQLLVSRHSLSPRRRQFHLLAR